MRAKCAHSLGVVSAAALLLPLAPLASAAPSVEPAAAPAPTGSSPSSASPPAPGSPSSPGAGAGAARPAPRAERAADRAAGSTQSLAFPKAASGAATRHGSAGAGSAVRIPARTVHRYALLGAVWEHANEALRGRLQVRTRDAETKRWSDWRELTAHGDESRQDDTDGPERGATAPLWVGLADGVEARVLPDGTTTARLGLPDGFRLELVDPGPDPARPAPGRGAPAGPGSTRPESGKPGKAGNAGQSGSREEGAPDSTGPRDENGSPDGTGPQNAEPGGTGSDGTGAEGSGAQGPGSDGTGTGSGDAGSEAAGTGDGAGQEAGTGAGKGAGTAAEGAGVSVLPALSREATEAAYPVASARPGTKPHIGPRPRIVTRKGWGANEKLRESRLAYTKKVKAVFVHHTAMTNRYSCKRAPAMIRAMYRYHVKSMKWRDIGYNFLVDKCGTVYEGRAGGVAKPVMGAHTYGFNTNTMGVAVLGSYDRSRPSKAAVTALSRLAAWKLGISGVNPAARTWLKSGGGKYKKGRKIRFHTVSGHKDGYVTECPGARLYGKLGTIRSTAARLQGR